MTDLDTLRETLDRLAHWMENVVGALDRHSAQLAQHEEQLRAMHREDSDAWPREVLALTGTSSATSARARLAAWKASYDREAALLAEMREDGEAPKETKKAKPAFGVPEIDLRRSEISADIIQLVPQEVAEKYQCLPVLRVGRSALLMAMSAPVNESTTSDIERLTGFTVEVLAAPPDALREAIQKYYPRPVLDAH